MYRHKRRERIDDARDVKRLAGPRLYAGVGWAGSPPRASATLLKENLAGEAEPRATPRMCSSFTQSKSKSSTSYTDTRQTPYGSLRKGSFGFLGMI